MRSGTFVILGIIAALAGTAPGARAQAAADSAGAH